MARPPNPQALRRALESAQRRRELSQDPPTEAPPPYSSGTSTRLSSPHDPTDAHDEVRSYNERLKSQPSDQYEHQVLRECRRLEYSSICLGRVPPLINGNYLNTAAHNVKSRWQAQGIWPLQTLYSKPTGPWKHEQTLDALSSGRNLDLQEAFQIGRDSEASRPYRQFLCQVEQEEAFIRDGTRVECTGSGDVKKSAFEAVKRDWVQYGIWDDNNWGELPGLTWKHEGLPPYRVAFPPLHAPETHQSADDVPASVSAQLAHSASVQDQGLPNLFEGRREHFRATIGSPEPRQSTDDGPASFPAQPDHPSPAQATVPQGLFVGNSGDPNDINSSPKPARRRGRPASRKRAPAGPSAAGQIRPSPKRLPPQDTPRRSKRIAASNKKKKR